VPDIAFVHMRFDSGTIANLEIGWLAPTKLRRSIVVGSRKMVVYDDTSLEPVRIFDSGVAPPDPQSFGEFQLSYRVGDVVSPPVAAVEPLSLEMRDFCRAVQTGSEPKASAQLGLDVVRVIEAIERSVDADGNATKPVPLRTAAG
jgi:predicted dehydrogenase